MDLMVLVPICVQARSSQNAVVFQSPCVNNQHKKNNTNAKDGHFTCNAAAPQYPVLGVPRNNVDMEAHICACLTTHATTQPSKRLVQDHDAPGITCLQLHTRVLSLSAWLIQQVGLAGNAIR